MATSGENIVVSLIADSSGIKVGLDQASKSFEKFSKDAGIISNKINISTGSVVKGFAAIAGINLGISGIREFGSEIIRMTGEMQGLSLSFETMLGSKAAADKMMADVKQFALETPYTITESAATVKQLIAMNATGGDVIATYKSLGDVAAGLNVPLSRIAINFGQVAALGKLQGREVRDFAMAGVPIWDELAKVMGKTTKEVQALVTAGEVGFNDVLKAFQNMSSEGGRFGGMMEKLNSTVTGQVNRLKDQIEQMFAKIGESNTGIIYNSIEAASRLVANYKTLIGIITTLVATYGTYKAILIATRAIEAANLMQREIAAFISLAKSVKSARDAFALFNVTVSSNPIMKLASIIIGVVSAMLLFRKSTDEATESIGHYEQAIKNESDEVNRLAIELSNANIKEADRERVIKRLNEINPKLVNNINDEANAHRLNTEELKKYNQEQVKKAAAARLADKEIEAITKYNDALVNREFEGTRASTNLTWVINNLKESYKDYPKLVEALDDIRYSNDDIRKKYLKIYNDFLGGDANLGLSAIDKNVRGWVNSLEYLDKQIISAELDADKATAKVNGYTRALQETIDKAAESDKTVEDPVKKLNDIVKTINSNILELSKLRSKSQWTKDEEDRIGVLSENIKDLKKDYESLTGRSWNNRTNNNAESELKYLLGLEKAYQDALINNMEDGAEKQRAIRKQEYKKEISDLQEHLIYLSKIRKSNSKIDLSNISEDTTENRQLLSDAGLNTSEIDKYFITLIELNKKYNKDIAKINEDSYMNLLDRFGSFTQKFNVANNKFQKDKIEAEKQGLKGLPEAEIKFDLDMASLAAEMSKALPEFHNLQKEINKFVNNATRSGAEDIIQAAIDELLARIEGYKVILSNLDTDENSTLFQQLYAEIFVLEGAVSSLRGESSKTVGAFNDWEQIHTIIEGSVKAINQLGDAIGGVAGDVIKMIGNISGATLEFINTVVTVIQSVNNAMQAATTATTAMTAALSAMNIATVVLAAITLIITALAQVFQAAEKYRKSIKEKLKSDLEEIDAEFQFRRDNPVYFRLLDSGSLDDINKIREGFRQVAEEYYNLATDLSEKGFDITEMKGVEASSKLVKQFNKDVVALQRAFVQLGYVSEEAIGVERWENAGKELEILSKQMLIAEQDYKRAAAEAKAEKEKNDDDKRKWEKEARTAKEKADKLAQEMARIISSKIEDIIGGTATSIAEQLGNAFVDAFRQGEDAAKAWGDTVNDIIMDMVTRNVIARFLEPQIEKLINQFTDDATADGTWKDYQETMNRLNALADAGLITAKQFNEASSALYKNYKEEGKITTEIIPILAQILGTDLKNLAEGVGDEMLAIITAVETALGITKDGIEERSSASQGLAQASQDSIDAMFGVFVNIDNNVHLIREMFETIMGRELSENTYNNIISAISADVSVIKSHTARLSDIETHLSNSYLMMRDVRDGVNALNR